MGGERPEKEDQFGSFIKDEKKMKDFQVILQSQPILTFMNIF